MAVIVLLILWIGQSSLSSSAPSSPVPMWWRVGFFLQERVREGLLFIFLSQDLRAQSYSARLLSLRSIERQTAKEWILHTLKATQGLCRASFGLFSSEQDCSQAQRSATTLCSVFWCSIASRMADKQLSQVLLSFGEMLPQLDAQLHSISRLLDSLPFKVHSATP